MHDSGKLQVKRTLLCQMVTTLMLLALGLLFDTTVAISLLAGAMSSTFGTAAFAFGTFGQYRAQALRLLVVRFYAAELLKIVVIATSFVIAFRVIEGVNPAALFGAYLVTQIIPTIIASSRAITPTKSMGAD